MASSYVFYDYLKMAEYYKQCGTIHQTRLLFHEKYGKLPSHQTVKKALAETGSPVVGDLRKSKKKTTPDSTESSKNPIKMEVKEEITEEITIKEETEDAEITIIEEIGDDEISIKEEFILVDPVLAENVTLRELDTDLKRSPLVYTTRLDDMEVFRKDLDSMSAQTIVDTILCESKPQLCKLSQSMLRIGRDVKRDRDVNSFNNILDKVDKYNHIATFVDFGGIAFEIEDLVRIPERDPSELCITERTKELLKLCKPLSITLTDINTEVNQLPIFITEITELANTHIDKQILRHSFFMFEDRYLNSTDIYFFNDKIVPTYLHHLNFIVSKNSELPLYKYLQNRYNLWERKVYKIVNCCWHKRENNIEFIAIKFFNCEATSLIKKPHLCALSKCVCCCKTDARQKSILDKTKKDDKTAKTDSSYKKKPINESAGWLIPSLNLKKEKKNCYLDTWFDEAMRNKFKSTKSYCRNALPNTPAGSITITRGTTIRNRACDYFEFGQGEKINFYAHCPAQKNIAKDVNVAACCWRKKKSIISDLRFSAHVKSFMNMPHSCPADKCHCCCSNAETSKKDIIVPLKDIELPKQPNYTKNYSSQFVPTGKSTVNNADFTHKPNIFKNKNVTKPLIAVKTVPTTKPGLKVPLVPPISSNTPDVSQDSTVNTLINSILERFKDIRLSLNAEGKIFAELNTTIDTLSTEELKVLSNILARVQEQVNSLGLAGNPYVQNIIRSPTTAPTIAVNTVNHKDAETNTSIPINQNTTPNVTKKPNTKTLPSWNTTSNTNSDNSKTVILPNPQITKPQVRQNLYETLDNELYTCSDQYTSYKVLMKWKNQQYKDSFTSFLSGGQVGTPIIENVFSLTGVNETTNNNDCSIDLCSDDDSGEPKPGPSGVRSWVNLEFPGPMPGPSGVGSKVNNNSEERESDPSRVRSGVKRTKSNKDEQNKKIKIKSLRELLSEGRRVPQIAPPLAAIGSSQLLHQELQAPLILGDNIITPCIVNNNLGSDLPVQSHSNLIDQGLQTPPMMSGNIITSVIVHNQLGSDRSGESHNNFVNMSSQLPALMPFNNPIIITNAVNLHVPTPQKTDDECILGV